MFWQLSAFTGLFFYSGMAYLTLTFKFLEFLNKKRLKTEFSGGLMLLGVLLRFCQVFPQVTAFVKQFGFGNCCLIAEFWILAAFVQILGLFNRTSSTSKKHTADTPIFQSNDKSDWHGMILPKISKPLALNEVKPSK